MLLGSSSLSKLIQGVPLLEQHMYVLLSYQAVCSATLKKKKQCLFLRENALPTVQPRYAKGMMSQMVDTLAEKDILLGPDRKYTTQSMPLLLDLMGW